MIGGKDCKYGLNQSSEVLEIGFKHYNKHFLEKNDVDVFCIASDKDYAYVNFFKVSSGAIIQAHAMEIKKKLDEFRELPSLVMRRNF